MGRVVCSLAVLAFASCTVPLVGTAPQAAPDPMFRQAAEARARQAREAAATIATRYDEVLDELEQADAFIASHAYEDALAQYRAAEQAAGQLLDWFADSTHQLGRGAQVRYATRQAGDLDESRLLASLQAARTRAQHEAAKTHDKVMDQLAIQLGATTPGQRAVLSQHGRPAVKKTRRQICWTYDDAAAVEIYCWTRSGTLARHETTGKPSRVAVRASGATREVESPAKLDQVTVARLTHQLGAKTKAQIDLIIARGRPTHVARRSSDTCWIYDAAEIIDAFCWTGAGKLASHDTSAKRVQVATRSPAPPPSRRSTPSQTAPAPDAQPQPPQEPDPATPPPASTASSFDESDLSQLASGNCGSISDNDLRSLCNSNCGSINDNELRFICDKNCGSISDNDLRFMCDKNCGSISDNDLRFACDNNCGSIGDANLRGMCSSSVEPRRIAAAWFKLGHR